MVIRQMTRGLTLTTLNYNYTSSHQLVSLFYTFFKTIADVLDLLKNSNLPVIYTYIQNRKSFR